MSTSRNTLSFVPAIFLIMVSTAVAGNAVNLSGTWVINQKRSGVVRRINLLPNFDPPRPEVIIDPTERRPYMGPLEFQVIDLTLLISQTDTELQVTRKFKDRLIDKTVIQKFALDGTPSLNPASNGRGDFTSSSSWNDGNLFNQGKRVDGSRKTLVKEEYSLTRSGKRLIIRTSYYFPESGEKGWTRAAQKPYVIFKQVFDRK